MKKPMKTKAFLPFIFLILLLLYLFGLKKIHLDDHWTSKLRSGSKLLTTWSGEFPLWLLEPNSPSLLILSPSPVLGHRNCISPQIGALCDSSFRFAAWPSPSALMVYGFIALPPEWMLWVSTSMERVAVPFLLGSIAAVHLSPTQSSSLFQNVVSLTSHTSIM